MTRDEYLGHVVRLWLGLPADAAAPQLPDPLGQLLLRDEERASPHRDAWGCWEYSFSDNHHRGAVLIPEIDLWVAEQRAAGRGGMAPWPDGHPFALAVSHDVDDLSRHITAAQWARQARLRLRGRLSASLPALPATLWQTRCIRRVPSLADSLEKALRIEAELGISASWFFTAWPLARPYPYDCAYGFDDPCRFRGTPSTVAQVIRAIAGQGHDVGLHGSYASAVDGRVLAAEKQALEAVLGRPVTSTRQHWLHWLVDRTPRMQAEAGLKVDGTLGFNGSAGFRAGTSLPHPLWDHQSGRMLDVLELPVSVMDVGLFRSGAMGLDLALAKRVVGQIIDRVAAAGGILSLLIHPSHLADPKVEAFMRETIAHCLDRNAWTTTHAGLRTHWDRRKEALGL